MAVAELREVIAAAIYFYQAEPPDRIAGRDRPSRPFEARAALEQWIAFVNAAEARGMSVAVVGHRAAADRVVRMLGYLSDGLPADMLDGVRAGLAKPLAELPAPAEPVTPHPAQVAP
jgi:hypothetical protein